LSPRSTGNFTFQLNPWNFWKLQNHPWISFSFLSLAEIEAPPVLAVAAILGRRRLFPAPRLNAPP